MELAEARVCEATGIVYPAMGVLGSENSAAVRITIYCWESLRPY